MKEMKKENGISLIVFTLIVVLLVGLAILAYNFIPSIITAKITIQEAKANAMLTKTENSLVYDCYGNKIFVPAGFKIVIDSTTNYKESDLSVTKGVVIEDEKGNQFVWIPVGKIYTNADKTEHKTIKFSRYTFKKDGTYKNIGDSGIEDTDIKAEVYYKELATSEYDNETAKDISEFKKSVSRNGGYYIARYEARKDSKGEVSIIKDNKVYNNISQTKAASLSRKMYGENKNFTSDLMNSYAWDTALVFLQTFDTRKNKSTPYSMQVSLNTSLNAKGTNSDVICNIYDMASNCREYTTETYGYDYMPCITRGGCFSGRIAGKEVASWRCRTQVNPDKYLSEHISFRPLLYIK